MSVHESAQHVRLKFVREKPTKMGMVIYNAHKRSSAR